jgi:hypothetical protein
MPPRPEGASASRSAPEPRHFGDDGVLPDAVAVEMGTAEEQDEQCGSLTR